MNNKDELVDFCLSINHLNNLNLDIYGKDFTFIINGEEIKTMKFISDILSPKISRIHKIDPTLSEYSIETKNHGDFNHLIQLVCDIGNESTHIKQEERDFFIEILQQLENFDFVKISPVFHGGIDNENVFNRLNSKMSINKENSLSIVTDELSHISYNFFELIKNPENLMLLSIDHLKAILSNEKLKLENEDSLFDFLFEYIHKKLSTNKNLHDVIEYNNLLGFIEFSHLSKEGIEKFIEKFDYNIMSHHTWESICCCLKSKFEDKSSMKRYIKKIEFSENDSLSGIITYLEGKYNGINSKILTVSSSSCNGSEYQPINATKMKEDSIFRSNNSSNQWLKFEFHTLSIVPSHYTIRSAYHWGANDEQPSNWVIESSLDGENWIEIDRRENNTDLNAKNKTFTFQVTKPILSKFIQLRNIGKTCGDNDFLTLSSFELFGEIMDQ
ncbi:hypothetical protein TRFO_38521 [Tritrichomonas foetus]|uniref:F5/8 type C domain-containing protein n=1 Tax=Tritrichomonas foetus TaxID=1144522 RepID=A0A1J4J842_9EUKA|nr:hypothetical protein TRFO_38521 [Tritrichomonas foetus]|eukprot:OHS95358.1 hypothetical protein TRFO_38521 [Tritrichomonas foetus]